MPIKYTLDYSDFLPPDVLEEVMQAENEIKQQRKRKHKPYPTSRELVNTIIDAVATFEGHPNDFPDYVYKLLEQKGYSTKFVTVKRIWATYEKLVRKRVISDRLGVVESNDK